MPFTSNISSIDTQLIYENISEIMKTMEYSTLTSRISIVDGALKIKEDSKEENTPINFTKIRERLTRAEVLSDKVIDTLAEKVIEILAGLNQEITIRRINNDDRSSLYSILYEVSWVLKRIKDYKSTKTRCILDLIRSNRLSSTLVDHLSQLFIDMNEHLRRNPYTISFTFPEDFLKNKEHLAQADSDYTCQLSVLKSTLKPFEPVIIESGVTRFATNKENKEFNSYLTDATKAFIEADLVVSDRLSNRPFPFGTEEDLAIARLSKFFSQLESNALSLKEVAKAIIQFQQEYCNNCVSYKNCSNTGSVWKCFKYLEIDRDLTESLRRVGRGV